MIISRLSSNTEIPVPSNSTREGSFWDLNLKNTEDVMMSRCAAEMKSFCSCRYCRSQSTKVRLFRRVKRPRGSILRSVVQGELKRYICSQMRPLQDQDLLLIPFERTMWKSNLIA